MKYFSIAIIYTCFFILIGFATYYTKSANCLWALIFMPSIKNNDKEK